MIPYRDLKPTKKFPLVTLLLIACNIAVFTYMLILPLSETNLFVYRYSAIPLEFRLGRNLSVSPGIEPIFTVFTAMFMHGGWFHIIGNMLYLWIFGVNVEGALGHFKFFSFYMLCGFLATFAQIYTNFSSTIPLLGASGAIAGILAAYLRLFPKAKIAVLVPIFIF
ncbi:MAG: rhomboid family intramembrane serine protease [Deltaproteobacteria bacterium]|nr:MAG: rhomboid family intramembrane serine protease [Deltaproteobacteria bacterium]